MAFITRVNATQGSLMKLKENLEFIQNGKNVLKTKRDRLAVELNSLVGEMDYRKKVEEKIMEAYADFREAFSVLGYGEVRSIASSVSKMKTDLLPISIMGVVIPKIIIKEKTPAYFTEDSNLHEAVQKLQGLVDDMFKMAEIEAKIERMSHELTSINRKVNALEKTIIPKYVQLIRQIEDSLFDEDLEDLERIKHVRDAMDRRKA